MCLDDLAADKGGRERQPDEDDDPESDKSIERAPRASSRNEHIGEPEADREWIIKPVEL